MTFKAFGKNIMDPDEYDLIRKMASIVTDEVVEIVDIMSFRPEIEPDDIILVYGEWAQRACNDFKCRARCDLPPIERLPEATGEAELRQEAFEKLLQFKEQLDSDNTTGEITLHTTEEPVEDPLPSFKCDQVKALEEATRGEGLVAWRGTTEDGKSLKLTFRPGTRDADICMTFAELWNLKALKDILHVKELRFVRKRTDSSRKGSSR